MKNKTKIYHLPCNPRLRHLCSTLCCATYSPILFGKMESGVYILQKSKLVLQLGGVVAICNPSGGRKVRTWNCLWGHLWACGRCVPSKPGVSGGDRSEGWVSRELERKAAREAGNRAAITFRSGQWRDSVPERFVVEQLYWLAHHVPPSLFTLPARVYFSLHFSLTPL